jgi:uncharacterized protein YndB with AHSA1/START domain
MDQQPVIHNTFVLERTYPVKPKRVFAAFADPAQKRRWYAEGEQYEVVSYEQDFRVGGRELYAKGGFKKGHPLSGLSLKSENIYREIVPNRRIIFTSTMAVGDKCISVSLDTVELLPSAQGTDLILTHQGAFLEGSGGPEMREVGWRGLLDKLVRVLAS